MEKSEIQVAIISHTVRLFLENLALSARGTLMKALHAIHFQHVIIAIQHPLPRFGEVDAFIRHEVGWTNGLSISLKVARRRVQQLITLLFTEVLPVLGTSIA